MDRDAEGRAMRPRRDEHGVPWCDSDCPQFEVAPGFGNLCRLLGCRPSAICEPAVRELALRVYRDLEVTPVELSAEAQGWLEAPSAFEDGEWPPEESPFEAARERVEIWDGNARRVSAAPGESWRLTESTKPPVPRAVEPERTGAPKMGAGASGEPTAHPMAPGESGSVFCVWCSTWGGHADGCAERRRGV
jgi:hypothetical protein